MVTTARLLAAVSSPGERLGLDLDDVRAAVLDPHRERERLRRCATSRRAITLRRRGAR